MKGGRGSQKPFVKAATADIRNVVTEPCDEQRPLIEAADDHRRRAAIWRQLKHETTGIVISRGIDRVRDRNRGSRWIKPDIHVDIGRAAEQR